MESVIEFIVDYWYEITDIHNWIMDIHNLIMGYLSIYWLYRNCYLSKRSACVKIKSFHLYIYMGWNIDIQRCYAFIKKLSRKHALNV